jgi:predicted RNA binding protein YcfA (HicA-like mRNA interferase family)
MRVAFNCFYPSTSFESAKARKLIKKVNEAEKLDKLNITFNELESMYNELGYDVFYKRGSHAVVHLTEGVNLPVIIPHKRKNVHPFDLKRFKYVCAGDIEKALKC